MLLKKQEGRRNEANAYTKDFPNDSHTCWEDYAIQDDS